MLIIYLTYIICFGVVTSLAAKSRNRDPLGWFFIGLLFGLFGLIAVLVMGEQEEADNDLHSPAQKVTQTAKTKKCPDCAEEIKYEAKVCRFCGKRFDETEVVPNKGIIAETVVPKSSAKPKGPKTERCSKCYTMNYESDKYCVACGNQLYKY